MAVTPREAEDRNSKIVFKSHLSLHYKTGDGKERYEAGDKFFFHQKLSFFCYLLGSTSNTQMYAA